MGSLMIEMNQLDLVLCDIHVRGTVTGTFAPKNFRDDSSLRTYPIKRLAGESVMQSKSGRWRQEFGHKLQKMLSH